MKKMKLWLAQLLYLPSRKHFKKPEANFILLDLFTYFRPIRKNDTLDMLLIGVNPQYQKLGASQLIFVELLSNFIEKKVSTVNTAIMLEDNHNVINLWNEFRGNVTTVIRRRCFIKSI